MDGLNGGENMAINPAGLLDGMFKGVLPDTVKPSMSGNDIKLVITEAEFLSIATKGIDERVKNAITVKILEGRIEVTVRLM